MARSLTAQPFLTLDAYRKLLNIPIWRFNGIDKADERSSACDMYWSQWFRDQLALAIYNAEMMLANALGFFIGARYITDRSFEYKSPMNLRYGYIVKAGTRKRDPLSILDYNFDNTPAWIVISANGVESIDEIRVIENETLLELVPDAIVNDGDTYRIELSQAKLIRWSILSTQSDAIYCDDTYPSTKYIKPTDLTVYREYVDEGDQAQLSVVESYNTTNEWLGYAARVRILDAQTSKVAINPTIPFLSFGYSKIKVDYVNYLAGTISIPGWEDIIISLAHTLMYVEPCGCSSFDTRWQHDANTPKVLTAERINCPFGQADGAWRAWKWVLQNGHSVAVML